MKVSSVLFYNTNVCRCHKQTSMLFHSPSISPFVPFSDVLQVRVAKSYINCPIPECSGLLEDGLVISHLTSEDVEKYHYFLELSQLDSSTKPCPQCSQFTSLKKHNPNRSEHKYKVRRLLMQQQTLHAADVYANKK